MVKDYSLELVHEIILEIRVNGKKIGNVSCTPQALKELAAGWLLTEGFLTDVRQITGVSLLDEGINIDIRIDAASGDSDEKLCERNMNRVKAVDAFFENDGICPTRSGKTFAVHWTAEDLAEIHRAFAVDPPLHAKTRAAHSCMVVRHRSEVSEGETPEGEVADIEILCRSEDAGRHSALDKAIGWAILNHVDLRKCLLMTSGRISTRMAAKAGQAGVSALAGKGTVTAEAVEIAKENGMSLIGYVGEDSAVWFYDAFRSAMV